ncbi:Transmembrane_domain-containing protein [Hexamita inflata]|uniref:Transmembrane domain-containing protein n=1 Tax=Hexamita inflata TaxID=28002 RepID=A0AA86NX84_9EUKA|nr:Transmembrane domain-containing protein [Hexamita inflata]
MRSEMKSVAFLNKVRDKIPIAYFNCECYHMNETEKIVTFKETRNLQFHSIIDLTQSLYITENSPLIYMNVQEHIKWLGNSLEILQKIKELIYEEHKQRDKCCSITFSAFIPGLTTYNYIQLENYPQWMNQALLWTSCLFQFDVLYLCMLRSKIPKSILYVIKRCSIDQFYGQQQFNNKIETLIIDDICPVSVINITPPTILEHNNNPLITHVKPQNYGQIDTFQALNVNCDKVLLSDLETIPRQTQFQRNLQAIMKAALAFAPTIICYLFPSSKQFLQTLDEKYKQNYV